MAMARGTRPPRKKTKRGKRSRSRTKRSTRQRKTTKAKVRRARRQEYAGRWWGLVYGKVYAIFQFDRILGVYSTKDQLVQNLQKLKDRQVQDKTLYATDVRSTVVDDNSDRIHPWEGESQHFREYVRKILDRKDKDVQTRIVEDEDVYYTPPSTPPPTRRSPHAPVVPTATPLPSQPSQATATPLPPQETARGTNNKRVAAAVGALVVGSGVGAGLLLRRHAQNKAQQITLKPPITPTPYQAHWNVLVRRLYCLYNDSASSPEKVMYYNLFTDFHGPNEWRSNLHVEGPFPSGDYDPRRAVATAKLISIALDIEPSLNNVMDVDGTLPEPTTRVYDLLSAQEGLRLPIVQSTSI